MVRPPCRIPPLREYRQRILRQAVRHMDLVSGSPQSELVAVLEDLAKRIRYGMAVNFGLNLMCGRVGAWMGSSERVSACRTFLRFPLFRLRKETDIEQLELAELLDDTAAWIRERGNMIHAPHFFEWEQSHGPNQTGGDRNHPAAAGLPGHGSREV